MDQKANKVEPDLAVFVFVGRIAVNPPVVLRLEWMTTAEVEEDMAEVDVSTLAITMTSSLMVARLLQMCLLPQTDERLQERMTPRTYQH
jgi:alkylation response protein AidB-like acyl-CoA dehydrogenase